jgi:hypothetical protein
LRLEDAARDVAEGNITLEEELDAALHNAVTERSIRLEGQGAFHNPPEQSITYELDMEAFQRSAKAIAARQERTAALMRNARPIPSSNINPSVSNSSVCGRGGGVRILPPLSPSHNSCSPHTSPCCYDSGLCYRAAGQCIDHCGSISYAPVIC